MLLPFCCFPKERTQNKMHSFFCTSLNIYFIFILVCHKITWKWPYPLQEFSSGFVRKDQIQLLVNRNWVR